MTDRVCACGCGHSLEGKRTDAVWHSRACAVRWARGHPGKSLHAARRANKGRTRSRSGPQLSYRKTVNALATDLVRRDNRTWAEAVALAEQALQPVLSARQRAQVTISETTGGRA